MMKIKPIDVIPFKASCRHPAILIVDDTPANIDLLARALSDHYKILVATSGDNALQVLNHSPIPDLVLLDVMMPTMDGYELCRRMKNCPETRNIPVIFVTAKGEITDQQLGFDAGAVDYITRPINLALVRARVKVHVELKLKSDHLENIAMIDGLTNIPNRRALDSILARECARSSRSNKPLTVMMIDIDHFKDFNDNFGHGVGDNCLRQVAEILEFNLQRPEDFIGRYGGEEFVVLLPLCHQSGAVQVAERLREAVASLKIAHGSSGQYQQVTISIGLACRTVLNNEDGSALLQEADQALYSAKTKGRNRVVTG